MPNKINFPAIEKKPRLCFVRKYRQNKLTRYIFYRADINQKVSRFIKDWLSKRLSEVDNKEYGNYTMDNFDDYEFVDLGTINSWKDFEEKAFSISTQEDSILEKIRHNLIAYIVYVKQKNGTFGFIRKITPSSLLNKKGLYSLFMDNSSFNDIKEQKGIEIDEYSDLVFLKDENGSMGIIRNKYYFNGIFDIFTQQKNDAVEIIHNDPVLQGHPSLNIIEKEVSNNRMFQKMLLNPVVSKNLEVVNFEQFKKAKDDLGTEVSYEVDEENKTIIFPVGSEKDAVHSYIRVKGYKYQKTIDDKHYLESNPERVIK